MRKLALALTLVAPAAHAVDFEASIGASRYQDVGNMTWYQEGLPHKLSLRSAGIQLGVAGEITPWLDWHAGYAYLGRAKSDAIATPDDANYDPVAKACRGECIARSRFRGAGDVQGVYLTLEPHVDYRGWRIGVSAGPFLYVARWHVQVDDWIGFVGDTSRTIHAHHKPKLNLGAVIGVSVGRGPVSIQYQRFFVQPRSNEPAGDFPTIWHHTDMLSVHYRF